MNKDIAKQIERHGIKITKEKLLDLIRKSSDKEFVCTNEGGQFLVVVKTRGPL